MLFGVTDIGKFIIITSLKDAQNLQFSFANRAVFNVKKMTRN